MKYVSSLEIKILLIYFIYPLIFLNILLNIFININLYLVLLKISQKLDQLFINTTKFRQYYVFLFIFFSKNSQFFRIQASYSLKFTFFLSKNRFAFSLPDSHLLVNIKSPILLIYVIMTIAKLIL